MGYPLSFNNERIEFIKENVPLKDSFMVDIGTREGDMVKKYLEEGAKEIHCYEPSINQNPKSRFEGYKSIKFINKKFPDSISGVKFDYDICSFIGNLISQLRLIKNDYYHKVIEIITTRCDYIILECRKMDSGEIIKDFVKFNNPFNDSKREVIGRRIGKISPATNEKRWEIIIIR